MTDKAPLVEDEKGRLDALYRYGVLDTPSDPVFDSITAAASIICETPIALISLLDPDRQWFKARVGLDATETSRDVAFCAHAITEPGQLTEVQDATKDERFRENPLVTGDPNIRFYAGQPLCTPDGYALGTLCVIDQQPKSLTSTQRRCLGHLANLVIALLEDKFTSPSSIIGRAFAEKMPMGLIIIDADLPDRPITFCNSGFEILTGYHFAEVVGKSIDFLHGAETSKDKLSTIENTIKRRESARVLLKNYHKTGSEFWNEFTLEPIKDGVGNVTCYLGFLEDVSKRVNSQIALEASNDKLQLSLAQHREVAAELADSNLALQEEMQKKQLVELQSLKLQDELVHLGRLTTMGEMATGMAHELNQPLLAVSQSADTAELIAKENPDSDPELLDCLRDIQSETQRAGEIIRALRQFVSRDTSSRSAVDINELIDQTVRLIEPDARLNNIAIKVTGGRVPEILADRVQIAQVLVNLLRNSVDAITDLQSKEPQQHHLLTINSTLEGEHLTVAVTDTGPGFDSAVEPFKAFETSKESGLGIGLSISRSIIESHYGKLWLDKNLLSGCRIIFTLPVAGN